MARLKLPYQPDITADIIYPLVLNIRKGRVEIVKPTLGLYEWVARDGVLVYDAVNVDIAFLLIWQRKGDRRRVYDIYVSERVDADAYTAIVKLVDLLWVGYGKSYSEIEEILASKTVKEIRKMLPTHIPPDA